MMTPPGTARIHILPARAAPYAAVIRRKPSKCFHIIRWNTVNGAFEHGSWFRGRLYPLDSDISHDGRWMVYLALGSRGQGWSGLCELPWLRTVAEGTVPGPLAGGGFWPRADVLCLACWTPKTEPSVPLPFRIETDNKWYTHPRTFHSRLERDGWRLAGGLTAIPDRGDTDWVWRFTPDHPVLRCHVAEWPPTFRFRLDGSPDLLDDQVDWACWDCTGALLVARTGGIARYTLADLTAGTPSFSVSLENLEPPRGRGAVGI